MDKSEVFIKNIDKEKYNNCIKNVDYFIDEMYYLINNL